MLDVQGFFKVMMSRKWCNGQNTIATYVHVIHAIHKAEFYLGHSGPASAACWPDSQMARPCSRRSLKPQVPTTKLLIPSYVAVHRLLAQLPRALLLRARRQPAPRASALPPTIIVSFLWTGELVGAILQGAELPTIEARGVDLDDLVERE